MSSYLLKRRGFELGQITNQERQNQWGQDLAENWCKGKPTVLKAACAHELNEYETQLHQASSLYKALVTSGELDSMLAEPPYSSRLNLGFEALGCGTNISDPQEIETAYFDAITQSANSVVAEDLWVKASWLSFSNDDPSLRFRFSFGVDFEEDVAADAPRQHYAAVLADTVFPESAIITENDELNTQLAQVLNSPNPKFVERIVYFNAPNGGAYLHHDRERGHAGVVYAQLSGATFWLALPRYELLNEIIYFIKGCAASANWPNSINTQMQQELIQLSENKVLLNKELDSFANTTIIHTINETEEFVAHLIQQQHGAIIESGDMLLMPQESDDNCCWHSVFCIGKEVGQALSFAIKRD